MKRINLHTTELGNQINFIIFDNNEDQGDKYLNGIRGTHTFEIVWNNENDYQDFEDFDSAKKALNDIEKMNGGLSQNAIDNIINEVNNFKDNNNIVELFEEKDMSNMNAYVEYSFSMSRTERNSYLIELSVYVRNTFLGGISVEQDTLEQAKEVFIEILKDTKGIN